MNLPETASSEVGPGSLYVARPERLLRERVVDVLRDAILRNELPPGRALVDRELGELTGVSRTSIREALRQLEAEGLVDKRPGGGLRVFTLTVDTVNDLYEVRAALEPVAVAMFIEKASDADFASLLSLSLSETDVEQASQSLDEFYQRLLAGARNPVLAQLFSSVITRLHVLRRVSLQRRGRLAAGVDEVRQVLAAIKERDSASATRLSAEHVANARAAALEVVASSQSAGRRVTSA